MAHNKNALLRYRTIDKCLQNRSRKWTLDDLIEACSDALYEYEGKDSYVSKRTTQLDIQNMRSDKLGYNAPIVVYNRKYYTYEDPHFSITDIPLTEIDMDILSESMELLKQFKDFSLFSELNGVIQKLEDKIYRESKRQDPIIHMDKNENLKGLEFLDVIYQSILKQVVLKITYKSFKARESSVFSFTPYILKEYNNRWFLVGRKINQTNILTLALDRIEKIDYDLKEEYDNQDFDADEYYKNTFGVTVLNNNQLLDIVLKIAPANAPYVLTKPIHHSQKLIDRHDDGHIVIMIKVHHNYEIERLILGFGNQIEVIRPGNLRRRIKRQLRKALEQYQ